MPQRALAEAPLGIGVLFCITSLNTLRFFRLDLRLEWPSFGVPFEAEPRDAQLGVRRGQYQTKSIYRLYGRQFGAAREKRRASAWRKRERVSSVPCQTRRVSQSGTPCG